MSQKLKLNIERIFESSLSEVYEAIKVGVLFRLCGADQSSMKIDFREGGSYELHFGPDGSVSGKFTKIIPNERISFTWGNGSDVTITLESKGDQTILRLAHNNIPDAKWLSDYRGGWEDGLNGLSSTF